MSQIKSSDFAPSSDKLTLSRDRSGQLVIGGVAATAATLIAVSPAQAQSSDPAAAVTTMVSSLSTIAGAALVVALVPMTISFAFRIVKRVMSF